MLQINERAKGSKSVTSTLTLTFEQRQRSRQRLLLDDGREAVMMLPRGTILRGGDCLSTENGEVIAIKAAIEEVSNAYCSDPLQLSRAAYHLGNRHVELQIGAGWLRYLRDHVLDHMIEGMGLQIRHDTVAFEPEAGAYHGHD